MFWTAWDARKKAAALLVMLLLLSPLTVNLLYSIDAPLPWLAAKFDAGSLLAFVGSVSACAGTVYLGYVTLQQTQKIEDKNAEAMELRNRWEKANTKRPFFVIKGVTEQPIKSDDGAYSDGHFQVRHRDYYGASVERFVLYITIANIGDGPAMNVRKEPETRMRSRACPKNQWPACLMGDELLIMLDFNRSDLPGFDEYHEMGRIVYENMLGQVFSQSIDVCVRIVNKYEACTVGVQNADDPYWDEFDHLLEVHVRNLGYQKAIQVDLREASLVALHIEPID